jgi:hypothetical protein
MEVQVTSASRTFEDTKATRQRVPVLVGLTGSSGSGKTFSALRLATGIQRVTGGDIGYIDTEARRSLHYADRFNFRFLEFRAPFGPLDYLAAIRHFASKGVRTIVVDSASHEHEGQGGVLEMHEQETDRLAKAWNQPREKVQLTAWASPKAQRRQLINAILQMDINAIFCFRAKEKLKIIPGKNPIQLGWMPIAGEEWIYEMTVNCLLYPAGGGVPVWKTAEPGELQMLKLPVQFEAIFAASKPLSEDIGEALAKWAAGDSAPRPSANKIVARLVELATGIDSAEAEARIMARNLDDTGLTAAGKAIKAGAKFDEEFPPLPTEGSDS